MLDDASQDACRIAVLIVAYRSAAKLEKCLAAAERHLPSSHILVWDNSGPGYGEVQSLAEQHPELHWVHSRENIGFAAAVNQLAKMAPGSDLLLLNPDAELRTSLSQTIAAVRRPGVAAAAPLVSDGTVAPDEARFLSEQEMPWDVAHKPVTLLNAIFSIVMPPQRLRGTPLSDRYKTLPSRVGGYLTGACLAIRREAWDTVGPFDEGFFLYGEEADWQRRATAAGWDLLLANEIAVQHVAQGTVAGDSAGARRSNDLFRAGLALQLEKRHGRWAADFFLATVSLIELIKISLLRPTDGTLFYDIAVTVDTSSDKARQDECVALASELDRSGQSVALVAIGALGRLPRDVPPSIRLVRRPCWWPSLGPDRTPQILIQGETKRERIFARLFRLHRSREVVQSIGTAGMLAEYRQVIGTSEPSQTEN